MPDTTSHAFTWEFYEFPTEQFRQNYFWDIFAVSDTNVWAVGQIYVDEKDSSGNFVAPYSAAQWNGEEWKLKRFTYQPGNDVLSTIRAIWHFSENDIWFASYSLFHFDGRTTRLVHRPEKGGIYHLWAVAENEIYGVGNDGLIMRYDGNSWTKMESGTTMDFQDIWGTVNEETGQTEVWTVGYDLSTDRHGIILKYDGSAWQTVFDENNNVYKPDWDHTIPTAVWGLGDSIYVSLSGAEDSNLMQHLRADFSESYRLIHNEDQGAIQAMHGLGFNDYFAVGHSDVILHYNGKSIKSFFPPRHVDGFYHGVQQKGNSVFVVGNNPGSDAAIVLIGEK